MDIKKCLNCGHLWTPRSEERPVVCPRCKSYSWDKKKKLPTRAQALKMIRDDKNETSNK